MQGPSAVLERLPLPIWEQKLVLPAPYSRMMKRWKPIFALQNGRDIADLADKHKELFTLDREIEEEISNDRKNAHRLF